MAKNDALEYNWPDIGRLEILMHGNHSAKLRFTPSDKAVEEGLAKAAKQPPAAPKSEAPSNPSGE